MNLPSPADVRARMKRIDVNDEKFNAWCRGQIERSFREIPPLLEQLDRDVDNEISAWVSEEGINIVRVWLAADTDAATLVREWRRYVAEHPAADRSPSLLATLIREIRVCDEIGTIAAFMHSNEGEIGETVTRLRHDVALALVKNSYRIRFHLGVKLSRNCSLGRAYIESVLLDDNSESTRRLQRDYGKLAVISSRFGNASIAELKQARTHLHAVLLDEQDVSAAAYLVESAIEEYHLSGDTSVLIETFMWAKTFRVSHDSWSNWWLVTGELMLHLAEAASSPRGREAVLQESDTRLRRAQEVSDLEITHEVRSKLLRAMVEYLHTHPERLAKASLRGLRLPFGLRRRSALPEILIYAAEHLISALRSDAERGQYIYRDALAGILTHTARASQDESIRELRLNDAIRLRAAMAGKQPLRDLRSRLDQAADRLLLSESTGDSQHRQFGLGELLRLSHEFPGSPDALVAIANEVQRNGAARIPVDESDSEVTSAVAKGDYRAILQRAARIAISSRDFRRRALGGRGTTTTLEDPNSISGQVFIIKQMTISCHERDERRTANTQKLLASHNLEPRFGVVEHVLAEAMSPEENLPESVMSVRRFEQGATLREALKPYSYTAPEGGVLSESLRLLTPAADYLALFHTDPLREPNPLNSRRAMWTRELGRWLKQLPIERESTFAEWWDIIRELPAVPRRDAHTQNWVVLADRRLLAVDLEASGLRPLAYELAQLIDDEPVFAPDDVATRENLVRRYLRALAEYGLESSFDAAWLGFQASQAARAVNLLTDSRRSHATVRHAIGLLESIVRSSTDVRLRRWCEQILRAWEVKAGRASPETLAHFTEGHRRRISKAMAFHLRHNPLAPLDREGWIFADDLSALLRNSGLRVDPSTLLAVAGALGESRFQLSHDSNEIRAAYGHSLRLRSASFGAVSPSVLWHGTALSNLDGVFSARSGLIAGARRHVHLSADIDQAQHVARRHSNRTVILQVDAKTVDGLFAPVEGMWLAPEVPVSSVRLPTVWRLAESAGLLHDMF
ncbi:MAG: RNA 2'-phosphotransferase [Microbacterium sp.]|uniref:RNA 2'-phosphotransferase n=1 Tax=Microbacterium sp. TaxID=51671 RepID=UPI003F951C9D